jgi:hypothetical protein
MAIASGNPAGAAERRGGSPLRFQGMTVTVHSIHRRRRNAHQRFYIGRDPVAMISALFRQ